MLVTKFLRNSLIGVNLCVNRNRIYAKYACFVKLGQFRNSGASLNFLQVIVITLDIFSYKGIAH